MPSVDPDTDRCKRNKTKQKVCSMASGRRGRAVAGLLLIIEPAEDEDVGFLWAYHTSQCTRHNRPLKRVEKNLTLLFMRVLRCAIDGAGGAFHPEVATVLRSVRLHGPSHRPEREGN